MRGLAQEPQVKKHKAETEDHEARWENYLQEFASNHFRSFNYENINWQDFRVKLLEHFDETSKHYLEQEEKASVHAKPLYKAMALAHLGALAALNGDHEGAIEKFIEAIDEFPGYLQAHYWLLATYYRVGSDDLIIAHVKNFKLIKQCANYVDALYPHLSLFSAEQIQEQCLYLAHQFFYPSEILFYTGLAEKRKNKAFKINLAGAYYWRATYSFFNNYVPQAKHDYERCFELCRNDYNSLSGKMYCQIFLGDYQGALEETLPAFLALTPPDEEKIPDLKAAINLCLRFRNPSRARFFMEKINPSKLSDFEKIDFHELELLLLLHDEKPYWPLLEGKFSEYIKTLESLTVVDQEQIEALETVSFQLHQCIQRYFEMKDSKNVINAARLILEFHDRGLKTLEGSLQEGDKSQKPAFPNRSYDRLYLRYLMGIIKLYSRFPSVEALDPLILLKTEIADRFRTIQTKLTAYVVPVEDNSFAPGVRSMLEHMQQLCNLAQVINGGDFGLADFIRETFLGGEAEEENNLSSEESPQDSEAAMEDESDCPSLLETYENYFSSFINLVSAKPEKLRPFFMATHFQRLMDSKEMAVQYTLDDVFELSNNQMLNLIDSIEPPEKCSEVLSSCMLEINSIASAIYSSLEEIPDELLRIFFREKLIGKYQSFYFRYLADINRFLTNFISNGDRETPGKIFIEHEKLEVFSQLCYENRSYHDEHSTLMSIKIRAAVTTFRGLKTQFHMNQAAYLRGVLRMTEASQVVHPLDVSYPCHGANYRVPFPAQLLAGSIKATRDAILASKNLSAHVLTLVFSLPASNDGALPKTMHLHLPLRLSKVPQVVHGIAEVSSEIPDIESNIIARIRSGHAIASGHRNNNHNDVCAVIPEGKLPADFNAVEHMHSEQYFYAWLSQQPPATILNLIRREPGGDFFREGVRVLMLSLDMASLRTSCHPCRLSALSAQNDAKGFVNLFSNFLRDAGFHVANNILTGITRIIAEKENRCDSVELKHKNPQEKNVSLLHNCAIFQEIQPDVFVSGASHKAFNK